MATANENPSKKFVNFQEFIDYQIEQTRKNVRATDLMTATAGGLAIVFGYLLLFVVLDHWFVAGGFSQTARIWMLVLAVVFTGGWIAWRIARPFMLRVTRLFAAKTLEDAQPKMRDSLFTLVDLKQSDRDVSPEVLESLEKRAAVNLSKTDVEHAVDRRDLMRVSYALLAVVVLFCLYSVLSPKKISSSVWRALIPAADIEAPTKTVISNVEPGNTEVLARTQLEVSAFISGDIPEEVLLKFTTADRRLVDETVLMRETDDGLGKYVGIINGENGRGILQDFTYSIQAGDDESDYYRVTVQQAPSAQIEQIDITFPKYMNLPPKKQFIGDVDTWEGATVKLTASTNMPVKSATVRFSDTDDFSQKAEEIMMNVVDGKTLEVEWPPLKFRTDGTHPNFFWIDCRTESGDADPAPVMHQLKLRRDVPPYVKLVDPTINLSMPANGIVPMVIVARDPDFELRYLTLRIEKDEEPISAQPLFEGSQSAVRKQYDLKLEPLRLKSGDEIQFWVEARDNKEPLGNRSNTPKITVTITEPVTPQQVEKQLQEDKQAQQQKLEAQRQQADEQSDSGETAEDTQTEDGMQSGEASDTGDETTGTESSDTENSDGKNATQAEQSQDGMNTGAKTESKDGKGEAGTKPGEEGSEPGEETGDGMGDETQSEKFSNDGTEDDLVLEELLKQQQQKEQESQNSNAGDQPNPNQPEDGMNDNSVSDPNSKNMDMENPGADNKGNNTDENMSDDGMTSNDKNAANNDTGDMPADDINKDGMNGDDPNMQDAANNNNDKNNKGPMGSDGMSSNNNEDGMDDAKGGTPQDANDMSKDVKDGNTKNPSDMPNDGDAPKENQNPNDGMGADSKDPMQDKKEPGNADAKMSDSQNAKNPNDNSDPANSKSKPGDGDEKGMGKPADDPNTESTPAKNKIEREEGTDPSVRPSDRDPMDADNKTAEGNKGKADPSNMSKDGMSSKSNKNGDPKNAKNGGKNDPGQTDSSNAKNMSDSVNDDGMPKESGNDSSNKPPSKTGDKPNAGDDDKKGKGDPASQQNDQPKDGGEDGSNTQNTDGMKGGMDKGPGDETGKPGDNQQAKDGQKGNPGNKDGKGQQQGEDGKGKQGMGEGMDSEDGMGSGKSGASSDAQDAKSGTPSPNRSGAGKSKPAKDGEAGSAQGGQGEVAEGAANGSGEGEGAGTDTGDAPNIEDKKKAANLVLQKLKDDLKRDEVDEELLKKLGWTEDDLKKFTDRLSKNLQDQTPDQNSPEELARKKQFEEMLRGIRLDGDRKTAREGANLEATDVESFAPSQAPAPLEYRELEEAYKNSLSNRRKK